MKKILVLKASSRLGGNSSGLADAFIEGAKSAGNQVEKLDLRALRIDPCTACDLCFSTGEPCVQDDDMDRVYEAIKANEVIVFAMPLYYYSIPAKLKAVIDRMYALYMHGGYPEREAMLLITAADSAPDTFSAVDASWRKILSYLGWPILGTVYAGGVNKPGDIDRTEYPAAARKLGVSVCL